MNDQQGGVPPTNPYGPGKTIVGEPLHPPDASASPPQAAFGPLAGAPVPQTVVEHAGPPAGFSPGTGTQPGTAPAVAGPYPGSSAPSYGAPGPTAPYGAPGPTAPYGAPGPTAPYGYGAPQPQAYPPQLNQPSRSSGGNGGVIAIIAVVGILGVLVVVGGVAFAFFGLRTSAVEESAIVPVEAPTTVSVAADPPAAAATPAATPAEIPITTAATVTNPAPAQPVATAPKPTTTAAPQPPRNRNRRQQQQHPRRVRQ
jgi:hypothetical protein